jgi:predicted metalloprotease with PDZ domain
VGDKVKEGAAAAKLETDKQLLKARESEAWQHTKATSASAWEHTKEGSQKAWVATQGAARSTRDHAEVTFRGKTRAVGFTRAKLGMTLAREASGKARPVVSRVDEGGAAFEAGVREGDVVVWMRAGLPEQDADAANEQPAEPTIKVDRANTAGWVCARVTKSHSMYFFQQLAN